MFAVVLRNSDAPAGSRLVAQYAMSGCACTISLVELGAPSTSGFLPHGWNGMTIEEGLDLARRLAMATASRRARSGS